MWLDAEIRDPGPVFDRDGCGTFVQNVWTCVGKSCAFDLLIGQRLDVFAGEVGIGGLEIQREHHACSEGGCNDATREVSCHALEGVRPESLDGYLLLLLISVVMCEFLLLADPGHHAGDLRKHLPGSILTNLRDVGSENAVRRLGLVDLSLTLKFSVSPVVILIGLRVVFEISVSSRHSDGTNAGPNLCP